MEQSIVALIRPRLNLAQENPEVSHLIEHILSETKRLERIGLSAEFFANDIIFHNGLIGNLYLTEFFVVRSESAKIVGEKLLKNRNEFHITEKEFENVKSVLIQEINEDEGEYIEFNEQISEAIFKPGSPSNRNLKQNKERLSEITLSEVNDYFHQRNSEFSLLDLSFNHYSIDRLPTLEKNIFHENIKHVELTHPWQSLDSVETVVIVPIPKTTDLLINFLYSSSLTNYRFGLLWHNLRDKNGLVYGISLGMDYNLFTLDIFFESKAEKIDQIIELIKKSLEKYDDFIFSNLEYLKKRLKLMIELDWGDIFNDVNLTIDRVVSGRFTEPPKKMLDRLDSITASDLSKFNQEFLNSLNNDSFVIKRRHGKTVSSDIVFKK